jgi:hypothetical protein
MISRVSEWRDEPSPGLAFRLEEDRISGSHPVAILSRGFWQSRFAADPGVIGRSVRINGALFTLVGVAPGNFNPRKAKRRSRIEGPCLADSQLPPRGKSEDAVQLTIGPVTGPGASTVSAAGSTGTE